MARAAASGGAAPKKKERGYAYKFPKVREEGAVERAVLPRFQLRVSKCVCR